MHCEILVYFLSFHEFVTIFIDTCSTPFVSVQDLMQAYLLQPGVHYVHTVPKILPTVVCALKEFSNYLYLHVKQLQLAQ